ncbi:MAG: Hrp-dependent type III effector protein [Mesorhizobium amorphae]|nr:MAG: Hrp-dependent type III effector protein [Mesorhizobium amorphae]
MEALELRGVPTVLFTALPSAELAGRFPDVEAVGIAGTSRSETPEWMDEHLPPVFRWLKASGAAITHYKVCSTFDSSPATGSIGRALEIGAGVFGQASTPLVLGAPELKRYTAFGNLFAGFRGENFRIDRHPVMAHHPVTPMDEADIRLHLGRQTRHSVGLVDLVALKAGIGSAEVAAALDADPVLLFDVLDAETQARVGALLWEFSTRCPFVVGSSGVEYALTAPESGTPLSGRARRFAAPGSRGPIAVVSGSCSPTTERQIRFAQENGFTGIPLDVAALVGENGEHEIARATESGSAALSQGSSPLLYTALGGETAAGRGGGHWIGTALGRILRLLIERHGLERVVVAGGDTSSHAIAELGIAALQCLQPLPRSPGSPLCLAHKREGGTIEVAFKGGQVGTDSYFALARDA